MTQKESKSNPHRRLFKTRRGKLKYQKTKLRRLETNQMKMEDPVEFKFTESPRTDTRGPRRSLFQFRSEEESPGSEANWHDEVASNLSKFSQKSAVVIESLLREVEDLKKEKAFMLQSPALQLLAPEPGTPSPSGIPESPYKLHEVSSIETLKRLGSLPETPSKNKFPESKRPVWDGQDLEHFAKRFVMMLRVKGSLNIQPQSRVDEWILCCNSSALETFIERLWTECSSWVEFVEKMSVVYPCLQSDQLIINSVKALAFLGSQPKPSEIQTLIHEFEYLLHKMSSQALFASQQLIFLSSKIHKDQWKMMRATKEGKARMEDLKSLKAYWLEHSKEYMEEFTIDSLRAGTPAQLNLAAVDKEGEADKPNQMKARITCRWCKRTGHYYDKCWDLARDLDKCKAIESKKAEKAKEGKGDGKGKGKGSGKGAAKGGRGQSMEVDQPQPQAAQAQASSSTAAADDSNEAKKRKRDELLRLLAALDLEDECNIIVTLNYLKANQSLKVEGKVGDERVKALVDTGATRSVISKSKIGNAFLKKPATLCGIRLGDGRVVEVQSEVDVDFKVENKFIKWPCLVLETSAFEAVVGMDFLTENSLGITWDPPRIIPKNWD